MLEMLMENQVMYYAMGVAAGIGVLSKLISQITIGRLVRAASKMSKSNHKFMRLVKAKFEHASMISDRVENVEVFLKKYIHEYKVFGIRLHTWMGMEKKTIWLASAIGSVWILSSYSMYGLGEQMLLSGAWTAGIIAALFLLYILGDESYRLAVMENYMRDFLENVYAHRYAKTQQQKELRQAEIIRMEENQAQEIVQEEVPEELVPNAETVRSEQEKEREKYSQELRIRQILEEFLA